MIPRTFRRIGLVSAIVALWAIFRMPWMWFSGSDLVSSPPWGVSGFALIMAQSDEAQFAVSLISSALKMEKVNEFALIAYQSTRLLALALLAALVCLGILVYSEIKPTAYETNRKALAVIRVLSVMVGGLPMVFFIALVYLWIGGLMRLWEDVLGASVGLGVWLALFAFIILGAEAVVDYFAVGGRQTMPC